jgi:hypothetical protein
MIQRNQLRDYLRNQISLGLAKEDNTYYVSHVQRTTPSVAIKHNSISSDLINKTISITNTSEIITTRVADKIEQNIEVEHQPINLDIKEINIDNSRSEISTIKNNDRIQKYENNIDNNYNKNCIKYDSKYRSVPHVVITNPQYKDNNHQETIQTYTAHNIFKADQKDTTNWIFQLANMILTAFAIMIITTSNKRFDKFLKLSIFFVLVLGIGKINSQKYNTLHFKIGTKSVYSSPFLAFNFLTAVKLTDKPIISVEQTQVHEKWHCYTILFVDDVSTDSRKIIFVKIIQTPDDLCNIKRIYTNIDIQQDVYEDSRSIKQDTINYSIFKVRNSIRSYAKILKLKGLPAEYHKQCDLVTKKCKIKHINDESIEHVTEAEKTKNVKVFAETPSKHRNRHKRSDI